LFLYFQCILASIIIIALQGMFRQFFELPKLWKLSKIDFVSIYILGVNSEKFQWNIGYNNASKNYSTTIMKRKFTEQPPKTIMLKKRTTTYGVGNPGPGLRRAKTCGRVKPMNGILTHLW
jgi:hypothetical protein